MKDKFNLVKSFPAELKEWKYKIEKIAEEEGLTYFDIIFEMVDWDALYQIAARGGFPERFPHWTFGQEYDHMYKQHKFGVMRISEMVINTDPVYAYLMTSNDLIDQKMVIAHVYGHADFFKNNMWFNKTDRKMLSTMGNHSKIIKRYIDKYGAQEVEDFIDICFSIDTLIDRHSIFINRDLNEKDGKIIDNKKEDGDDDGALIFDVDPERFYMNDFLNPTKKLDKEREDHKKKIKEEEESDKDLPEKDLLKFLIKRAPLKPWQKHILSLIREEAYYFAPQGMTKIMNEGWASYWHSHILSKRQICDDSEIVQFATHHAGTMGSSGNLNPYKLGLEIFLDIEERWNKGRFGKEWEECDDLDTKENWDKELGLGREKIFEVRKLYSDIGFIDEFFTKELCEKLKLFNYDKREVSEYGNSKSDKILVLTDREFDKIKQRLLFSLSNHGLPALSITNADAEGRGMLLLEHSTDTDYIFNVDDAKLVCKNIRRLWKKPVKIELVNSKEKYIYNNSGGDTAMTTGSLSNSSIVP
jgi:stage V sporulation protein R